MGREVRVDLGKVSGRELMWSKYKILKELINYFKKEHPTDFIFL